MRSRSERFGFGRNWKNYLETINPERIEEAEKSLKEWLDVDNLTGRTFLDIGSGSGLFSLAAKRMGATVRSFDYDADSVDCTRMLKEQFYPEDASWTVEWGDVLDNDYLSKYDNADVVYSWGVLHHTGDMYRALANAGDLVRMDGRLYIAIYNDQGSVSKMWLGVKKLYNKLPTFMRIFVIIPYMIFLWVPRFLMDLFRLQPFEQWRSYKKTRGMSPVHDAIDWCGGYPFEVAKPEEILDFYTNRGFELMKLSTCGGHKGCNQFLFKKSR